MNTIPGGTIHTLPADLKQALNAKPKALATWQDITPLARNEWICWTTSVKQEETRKEHVRRAIEELQEGKRRPCCWMGCVHRKDKPMNSSQKFVLGRKVKRSWIRAWRQLSELSTSLRLLSLTSIRTISGRSGPSFRLLART